MMDSSGHFRRFADEQAGQAVVMQERIQGALRDAAARIDWLEKRILDLDAAAACYQAERDMARMELKAMKERSK